MKGSTVCHCVDLHIQSVPCEQYGLSTTLHTGTLQFHGFNSGDSMREVVGSALGPANSCSETYQGFPSLSPHTRHNKHILSNSLSNLPLGKTVWASN